MKYLFALFLTFLAAGSVCGEDISERVAVMMLLENNTDIRNADIDIQIAQADGRRARSMFMPVFEAGSTRIFDENYLQNLTSATVSKMFSTGTTLSVSGGNTNMDFESILVPDTENSSASVSLRQALLRDSFGRASRRTAGLAELGVELSQISFLFLKEEMILRTVDLYWRYVFLNETVHAEQERYKYYDDLLELVLKKRSVGAAEKRDVLITRDALLQSRNSLRNALYRKQSFEVQLRMLISPDRSITIEPDFSGSELVDELEVPSDTVDLASMFTDRAELRLIRKQLEMARMQSEMNSSNALPSLDLIFAYGTDGINLFQAGYIPPDPLDSAYMVGLSFRYIFGGGADGAMAEKSFLETSKLNNILRMKQQEAAAEYLDSIRQYRTALEMYRTGAEILQVNREKIDNEMTELKNGRSTFERLVEFENMYIGARLSYYNLLGDMRRAAARLRKNTGSLIDFYSERGIFGE